MRLPAGIHTDAPLGPPTTSTHSRTESTYGAVHAVAEGKGITLRQAALSLGVERVATADATRGLFR